jgi:hypothetical protein
MAMQKKTWSLSGLSTELDTDRRTLARRLQDLPPAETKRIGSRIEKRWHLADVLEHLGDAPAGRRRTGSRIDADMVRRFNEMITQDLMHDVIDSTFFRGLLLNGMRQAGLDENQMDEVMGFVILGLVYSVEEILGAPGIAFDIPAYALDIMRKAGERRTAANGTSHDAT